MESTASATSKVTVTYWDPSSVLSLLSPELRERLPLKNLHWKSASRPLRSIHTLQVDLVNGNPAAQTLSPTLEPFSTANNAQASSPVGSVALSRTHSTDSTSSMPATTSSSASHTKSPSLSVIHSSKASTSTPNLGTVPQGQVPVKQRRHQIPGMRQTPYLKIYFLRCDDNDTYRGTVRKQLKEWIAQNCTSAGAPPTSSSGSGSGGSGTGGGSSGKGDRHDAFEWLVIHVVLPGTAAAAQPRLSSQSGSNNRSSSPGGQSAGTWRMKSSGTVIEKIRNDVAAATKKSNSRVVQLRLSHPAPAPPPPGTTPTVAPLPTPAEKEADWASLINHMKNLILTSFDTRVQQYEDDIIAKSNQQHLPGWNFCTFFLLKEGLAGAFESVGLLEDAGTIYHELAVAGEMVVRGEEKGREGVDTFLRWSGDAVQTLQAEGRRFNRRKRRIRDSELSTISTLTDVQEETLDEESSILSSSRKPYRELILSSNISVFDFLCYVFTRQIALLMSLASSLPVISIPVHPATSGASYSFSTDPISAAADEQERDGHTAYLADVVRRGIEFLRMAGAVLRVELWAAWNSIENPERPSTASTTKKSFDGPKPDGAAENGDAAKADDDDSHIPHEYAHILINNIVSSFITTGTLHLLNATEHPALPQLNTNIMLRDTPLSPPPTPSMNENFGENPSSKPRQPSPRPSVRAKSAIIYTDTGKGLGIAKDKSQRPEVEELAGVRAEAVGLAKGIVLELAGGRFKWNQDEFKEMPPPEDDMEDVDLNGDADKSSVGRNSLLVEKDGWLWLWGIRNKSLRHALGTEEGFLQVFERMSEIGLKLCTTANRKKSAERILADLATLRFHAKDYETAVRYFQELTPFYTSQGWSLIESSLLSIYAVCLKKMNKYDEYFAVVVQLLRKHAADERIRLQSILQSSKPAYLQPRYYGDAEEDLNGNVALSPVSVRSVQSTTYHSASLISILKELSEKIIPAQLSMETLWTDLMVDPYPARSESGSTWRARVKWRWLLSQEIILMNGKLTLAILDGKTIGRDREIVLESHENVIVKKGRGGAWFDSNMILPSRYQPIKLQFSINNITFIHNFPNDHPPLLIYARPSTPSASLHLPKTISLDKVRNVEIRIDAGDATVLEAELLVKSMTGGLRIMVGDASLLEIRDKDEYRKVKLDSEHAGEGVLILKPEVFEEAGIPNCRLSIPYKSDGDLNELSLQLELSYKTEKGNFTYLSSPSIRVSLPLAVNVQDVFKKDALFSKFQVSAASHVPLRVISSSLSTSELYHTQTGLGIVGSVIVFPKQPSNFLYRITRKPDGKPLPESRKPLTLRIEYRTLGDEVELALLDSLHSHLRVANFSRYATLLSTPFSKKILNLPAAELDAAALVNSVRLGTWEENEAVFTSALEGIPATGGEREKVLQCLKGFFHVEEERDDEPKIGDIRVSGEVHHDGTVKRKKKTPLKRIPLLEGGNRVTDITRSIDIPVEIPALQVLCTARMELFPKGAEGREEPLMVTLGEAIPAKLYVSYTRVWDPKAVPQTILWSIPRSESPSEMMTEEPEEEEAALSLSPEPEDNNNEESGGKRKSRIKKGKGKDKEKDRRGPPLSLFYEITTTSTLVTAGSSGAPHPSPNPMSSQSQQQQQVQNDWLLSGKRRATFQAYEDEEVVFNFVLMPLRAGYLLLPGVEVKGSQVPYIDGSRRGSTIIKDTSGGLTFTCETDYRSAAAEVMVVAEVASTTVKIQPEIQGRPGSAGNMSVGMVADGGVGEM